MEDNIQNEDRLSYNREEEQEEEEEDEQSEDNKNQNSTANYQNFDMDFLEGKISKDDKENPKYEKNNKNMLSGSNIENNYNQNEKQNFLTQNNQTDYYNNNNTQKQIIDNRNFQQNDNNNQNKISNLFQKNNQNNLNSIQSPFINQEKFSPDLNFNQNRISNLSSQNNYNIQNQFMAQGNFPSDFNFSQNKILDSYSQNNFNDFQNPLMTQGNFTSDFNYNLNRIINLSPPNNQNNLTNIQNPFMAQGYLTSNFIQQIKDRLFDLFFFGVINNSQQKKDNFFYQNNTQNNPYNFQNNNNFGQNFQNFEEAGQSSRTNNFNYSNFYSQNRNNNSYNIPMNINQHNNLHKISNNKQKRKNTNKNKSRINNEKKLFKKNISPINNINLFENKKIKYIKDLNINELLDLNYFKIIPDMNDFIRAKAEKINYKLNDEENKLLDDNNYDKSKTIFFNEYMFYSKDRISIYSPHILKRKNKLISILLPENEKKLNLSDFQYSIKHQNMNDIFFRILQRRIEDFNILMEKSDIIKDENSEKKFGFCKNKNNDNYFLYSIIDEDIIKSKLKENDLEYLKRNLIMNQSEIYSRNDALAVYEKNMKYLKGLTFEELILFIILDRLKKNYEILPRILFYENYMTIMGERINLLNSNHSGYSEIDYVIYSKINCKYDENSPLIIQNYYNFENKKKDLQFEIKKDTLYFFELKSSSYYIKDDFFDTIFNKCQEFVNLYESKNMIDKNIKKEIMLIYDNKEDYKLSVIYEQKIMNFLNKNKNYSFNIVYTVKTYAFFSHSLAIKKYEEIKTENESLAIQIQHLKKEIEELKAQKNENSKPNQNDNKKEN